MADLIRRQDAINCLCNGKCNEEMRWCDDGPCPPVARIMKLPSAQPEQQWIPCSERLPEIGKEVLLSEPNTMFIAEYHGSGDPEGLWLVDGCHHYLADVNGCAWMPLPEPY